jgi:hypothetical protein
MTTIDELEKREKKLAAMLHFFVALLVLIGIVLIGALISFLGQGGPALSSPAREAGSLLLGIRGLSLFA